MPDFMIPCSPSLRIELNGTRIGMITEFRERTDCDLTPVRSIGINLPAAVVAGPLRYTVTLQRILLDTLLISEPFELHNLHGFSLKIGGTTKSVTFSGCEFTSISVSNSIGGSMIEEAVLQAASRAVGT